jgi:hypothetical protein
LVIVEFAGAHAVPDRNDGQLVEPLNRVTAPADGVVGVTLVMTGVGVSATGGGADVTGRNVTDICGVAKGLFNEVIPVVPTMLPSIVTTVGEVVVAAGGR